MSNSNSSTTSDKGTKKNLVHSVPEGANREKIYATTGQMRNFYSQLGDGYFSVLDVMNYMQHHMIASKARRGDHLLDMCCGRGLLLPLLRYLRPDLGSYTGVDIEKGNATFRTKKVNNNKPLEPGWYTFPVYFLEADVAEMSARLPANRYNLIAYTSSIEHMHPTVGAMSLHEAYSVAAPGATMFLTCPNTPEDVSGYDTQYSYHVYEWKKSEILKGLQEAGWHLETVFGLLISNTALREAMPPSLRDVFEKQHEYIPNEWLQPLYAFLFPEYAKEIAYVCTKGEF